MPGYFRVKGDHIVEVESPPKTEDVRGMAVLEIKDGSRVEIPLSEIGPGSITISHCMEGGNMFNADDKTLFHHEFQEVDVKTLQRVALYCRYHSLKGLWPTKADKQKETKSSESGEKPEEPEDPEVAERKAAVGRWDSNFCDLILTPLGEEPTGEKGDEEPTGEKGDEEPADGEPAGEELTGEKAGDDEPVGEENVYVNTLSLCRLMFVADILSMQSLLDLLGMRAAEMIEKRIPKEIRKLFHITPDHDEESIAKVRKENGWTDPVTATAADEEHSDIDTWEKEDEDFVDLAELPTARDLPVAEEPDSDMKDAGGSVSSPPDAGGSVSSPPDADVGKK